MTRLTAFLVALLLVGAAVGTVTLSGGADAVPPPATDPTGTEAQTDEAAPTGGLVSSVVGMEEADVDARMAIARFETRFQAASTDAARAETVARSLNASRAQVQTLERRLQTLRERRENGTISEGWFRVETAWLLSSAETREQVVARLARAARSVPRAELAARNATAEDVERLQQRIERLQEIDAPDIHRTTLDRQFYRQFAQFVQEFNESATGETAGPIDEQLAGERVNIRIEPDVGAPAVLSVRLTDDTRMTEIRAGQRPDATVRMRLAEVTARRLVTAENPRQALSAAMRDGEVTVRELSS